MNPEEEELLKKNLELSEENNSMLRSIQRSMRLSRFMSMLYWIFIIGSAIGAYYLIQPYLEAITGSYTGAKSNLQDSVSGLMDTIKDLKQ